MGIHDYIDFIQRNGQNVYSLDILDDATDELNPRGDDDIDDCENTSSAAIIVHIPKTIGKETILSMNLPDMQQFQYHEEEFDSDEWDFVETKGHNDAIHKDEIFEQIFWESEKYPDHYLINFEPNSYKAFVQNKIKPELIPWAYFESVFENRNRELPLIKEHAFKIIQNSGNINLNEFHNIKKEPIPCALEYLDKIKEINSRPIFSQNYSYKLKNKDESISVARLFFLVRDNISIPNELIKVNVISDNYKSGKTATYSYPMIFNINFSYKISIDTKLINGCIMCGGLRDAGCFTCCNHEFSEIRLNEAKEKVIKECERLLKIMNTLTIYEPPQEIIITKPNIILNL